MFFKWVSTPGSPFNNRTRITKWPEDSEMPPNRTPESHVTETSLEKTYTRFQLKRPSFVKSVWTLDSVNNRGFQNNIVFSVDYRFISRKRRLYSETGAYSSKIEFLAEISIILAEETIISRKRRLKASVQTPEFTQTSEFFHVAAICRVFANSLWENKPFRSKKTFRAVSEVVYRCFQN